LYLYAPMHVLHLADQQTASMDKLYFFRFANRSDVDQVAA
jgi:hypothetical protein